MAVQHVVYLVRHGQCLGNVSGNTPDPKEDFLTELGKQQVSVLGEHLKSVVFTKVFSSPYLRALETTKGILERQEASSVPPETVVVEHRIRERDFGDYIGWSSNDIILKVLAEMVETGKKPSEIDTPGGETAIEFVGRQKSFFKELFDSLKSSEKAETVLIVSHGLFIRRFMCALNYGTYSDVCEVTNWDKSFLRTPANTSCTIFTVDDGNEDKVILTFTKMMDDAHLGKLPGGYPGPHRYPEPPHEHKLKRWEYLKQIPKENFENEMPECIPS